MPGRCRHQDGWAPLYMVEGRSPLLLGKLLGVLLFPLLKRPGEAKHLYIRLQLLHQGAARFLVLGLTLPTVFPTLRKPEKDGQLRAWWKPLHPLVSRGLGNFRLLLSLEVLEVLAHLLPGR